MLKFILGSISFILFLCSSLVYASEVPFALLPLVSENYQLHSPQSSEGRLTMIYILQKDELFRLDWNRFQTSPSIKFVLISSSNINECSSENTPFLEVLKVENLNFDNIVNVVEKHSIRYNFDLKDSRFISNDEYGIEIAGRLREYFQCYGAKPDDLLPFRNKHIAKDRLASSGVSLPNFKAFKPSETQSSEVLNQLGLPIFVKPVDEARCKDVAKIATQEELNSWWQEHETRDSEFIAETYLDGSLYTGVGIVVSGELVAFGGHKFLHPCFNSMAQSLPLGGRSLHEEDEEYTKLLDSTRKTLLTLAKDDGVYHVEFIEHFGELMFIEAAARTPGGYISDVISPGMGLHLAEVHFLLGMGQTWQPKSWQTISKGKFAAWFWPPKGSGRVQSLLEPNIKSFFHSFWRVQPGETLTGPHYLGDSSVRLLLHNDRLEHLQEDLQYLEQSYQPIIWEP